MTLRSNVKFTCDYDNDSGNTLEWQNSGAGEMCVLMMFTNGTNRFGADLIPTCEASGGAIAAL